MWESKVTQALWKANLATAIDIENEQFFHLLILHLKDMFAEVQKKKVQGVHYNTDLFTKTGHTVSVLLTEECINYGTVRKRWIFNHHKE